VNKEGMLLEVNAEDLAEKIEGLLK